MSWDISVFGGSDRPRLKESLWYGNLPVIGTPEDVRRRISAYLPYTDWSDPTWGLCFTDEYSFEFNLAGDEELVTHFFIHARGSRAAITTLLGLAVLNGWHLMNWSTGELIDPESPAWRKAAKL
jgi:hypothetical protein